MKFQNLLYPSLYFVLLFSLDATVQGEPPLPFIKDLGQEYIWEVTENSIFIKCSPFTSDDQSLKPREMGFRRRGCAFFILFSLPENPPIFLSCSTWEERKNFRLRRSLL